MLIMPLSARGSASDPNKVDADRKCVAIFDLICRLHSKSKLATRGTMRAIASYRNLSR